MFKNIAYITTKNDKVYYTLSDSDFTTEIKVDTNRTTYPYVFAFVMKEYQNRKLAAAPAIAKLYDIQMDGYSDFMTNLRYHMDLQYPELEYGRKYHLCVIRLVKKKL